MAGKTLLRIVVTIGIFAILFRSVDIDRISIDWADVNYAVVIASFLLLVLQLIFFRALRWNLVLQVLDRPLSYFQACVMNTVSQFFNQVLPSTVGGDGVRIYMLHREGRALGTAVHSVVIDRITGVAALLVLCVLTLPFAFGVVSESGALEAIFWMCLVLSIIGVFLPWFLAKALHILPDWRLDKLRAFQSSVERLWAHRSMFVALMVLSVIGHGILSLTVWTLANATGLDLAAYPAFLLLPTVFLMTAIPISLGGWGVREGAMVLILALIGIPGEQALMMSIIYGVTELSVCSIGGIVWLLYRRETRVEVMQ